MRTSSVGVASIRLREGCRLVAYRDSKGIPTIGVGHVDATPPVTKMGMTITQAEADMLLAADLAPFEAAVNGAVKVPLSQNQFDACVSLAFNIGAHGFAGSTVVHKLNAGDPAGAADAFLMWEKPPELKGRRIQERAQFLNTMQAAAPAERTTFAPPHIVPKPSTAPKAKAKVGAVVVAAGAAAGAAYVPHGGVWMAGLVVIALVAAGVAAAIHWHK